MIRFLEALVIIIVYIAFSPFARGQVLNGKLLRLNPTALPATCAIGDLRVDSGDSYKLKLCSALNTWGEISPTGVLIDPMTTTGDLISRSAGVPTRIAAGTSGHLLTSNGAGTLPSWQAAPISLPTGGASNTVLKKNSATDFDSSWSLLTNSSIDPSAAIAYSKLNLTGSILSADLAGTIDATKIADGSVTSTEFQYINTLSSNAQTQLSSKASTTLNNLGTTAINASLLVDSSTTYNLGSSSFKWNNIYGQNVHAPNIYNSSGQQAISTNSFLLTAPGGQSMWSWDDHSAGLSANTHKITGVVNPTATQDAATRNYVDTLVGVPLNLMTDPGFESGGSSWTASGGTATTASSGSGFMGIGLLSGTWDSSGAGQTWTSGAYTVGNGFAGTNGLFRCKIRVPSGTATHTMGLWDGSTLTDTITIPATDQTVAKFVDIMKPFGAATSTIAIRFTSVNANEPLISVDACYIGYNFLLSDITPVKDYGTETWTLSGATGTASVKSIIRVGPRIFVEGLITLSSTVSSQPTLTIPAAYTASATTYTDFSSQYLVGWTAMTDVSVGSRSDAPIQLASTTTLTLIGESASGSYLGAAGAGASIPFTWASGDQVRFNASWIVAGWPTQNAIKQDEVFDTTGMFVPFGGSTCPVGTLAADGTAVSRTTYSQLFAKLSTTYGTGDGSTTFNLPNTSGVFVRGSGSQVISTITYTGTRGTTQGDQMQGHRHGVGAASGGANVGGVTFAGQTTNATSTDPITDGSNGTPRTGTQTHPANISALYCIVTNGQKPAPLLVGSITSNTTGLIRMESATFTCSSSSAITRQSSTLVSSVGNISAGACSVVLDGGYSVTPTCVGSSPSSDSSDPLDIMINTSSTTAMTVDCATNAGADCTGYIVDIICIGPK